MRKLPLRPKPDPTVKAYSDLPQLLVEFFGKSGHTLCRRFLLCFRVVRKRKKRRVKRKGEERKKWREKEKKMLQDCPQDNFLAPRFTSQSVRAHCRFKVVTLLAHASMRLPPPTAETPIYCSQCHIPEHWASH